MNNDDESFLSAYIDGELTPGQQQLLESAIVESPQLAEKLRGLTLVRDLVAGLPHDGSVDVSARVMQDIQARNRQRGFLPAIEHWRRGSRRILPLAGLAASAASLMVAASLAIMVQTSQFEGGRQPVGSVARANSVVQSNPTVIAASSEVPVKPGEPAAVSPSSHSAIPDVARDGLATASSVSPIAADPRADVRETWPSGDAAHVRQLLDHPNLKGFFRVRNGPRNDSEQVVASLIERTTHLDFFKITVAEGIVIDPRHPEEAKVLAFVVKPSQLERFHDQLNDALPGLVEQQALDPVIATQLADIDRVQSFPAASLAEVEIPRDGLALRTRPIGGNERPHSDQEGATAPKEAGSGTPSEGKNVVVLVWVANPAAR